MSLSCCTQHPTIPVLWSQMLNRTLAPAAAGQSGMAEWRDAQLAKWHEQAARQKGSSVLHLLTRSPSTQQTGGLYRATLRGHTAEVKTVAISPSGQQVVTASSDGTAQVGAAGRRACPCGGLFPSQPGSDVGRTAARGERLLPLAARVSG